MTDAQADLTERARALVTEMQDGCGIYHASMIGRIAAFAAEARRAAIEGCAQAAFKVADEELPRQHWDLARERRSLWASACGRIMERIRALASPAPQDDLEGDVKHGNAEYFRAALAHAAAEARRAALEEAALLILDCNTLRGDKLADILATGIRALASPAPQEE